MGAHSKAKKNRTNDKWYRLAKDQGFRARSAYKLLQINKKFGLLDGARSIVDLCAAPGGWCQVARKVAPQASIVLGFDLLPIKPIPGVKTFVCDITTPECRQIISRELQTFGADVVLCDGAPNVGSAYAQDAFVQNALALSALRLACDSLIEGGSFVTKVFRSADYNKLLWVIKQLFRTVNATKPVSSRQESAEIFLVAQGYLAPASIDPRLLSADHVFTQVEGGEGGDNNDGVDIFHKKFNTKRHRSGYDDAMGISLRRVYTAAEFVAHNEPVKALSHATEISFEGADDPLLAHAATTEEVRACLADLRVLGKGDFKRILKWRLAVKASTAGEQEGDGEGEGEKEDEPAAAPQDPEDIEAAMDAELAKMRADLLRKQKRERKKRREKRAKHRVRLAMSMNGAIELPGQDDLFQLKSVRDAETLQTLDGGVEASDSDLSGGESSAGEDEDEAEAEAPEPEEYAARLEEELDASYRQYAESRNLYSRREKAKRSKKVKTLLAAQQTQEDAAMYDGDMQSYAKLLNQGAPKTSKKRRRRHRDADSDEGSSDDARDIDSSDEEEDDAEDAAAEEERGLGAPSVPFAAPAEAEGVNPLLTDLKGGADDSEARAARWFSNPIFDTVTDAAADAVHRGESSSDDSEEDDSEAEARRVLAEMPMTDKERRKVQRKAREERKARKEARRAGPEDEDDFDVVPARDAAEAAADRRTAAHRARIAAGFGAPAGAEAEADDGEGFEVVPAGTRGPVLPAADPRKYDSDHEDYDDEDRAQTLALATMMLRKSKAKDMVDASYNRFAFNDAPDLPEWFTRDEQHHLRPQLPIAEEVMQKMREKFVAMSNKPIKKVAEARARKRKRAVAALNAAKQKAHTIANSTEVSAREKMRAIEKTLRQAQTEEKKKVYVVSRRSHGGKTPTPRGQRTKLVDPRLKSDMRAKKRREAGRGKGKRRKR